MIMTSLATTCRNVLKRFPMQHVQYVFCYGSGAFQQTGSNMAANVLDFILVVSDAQKFHKENIAFNGNDYSFVKFFGPVAVASLQGSGAYFNTLVRHGDRTIKYGVTSTHGLIADLRDWTHLYISGRLHKPVMDVYRSENVKAISDNIQINLCNAVNSSLLLLPEEFSEEKLFLTIAALSYTGDPRMTVGEDKNKVSNIVKPNMDKFRSLYHDVLHNHKCLQWSADKNSFLQSCAAQSRLELLQKLPAHLLDKMAPVSKGRQQQQLEELSMKPELCKQKLGEATSSIVRASSYEHTLKSIVSAGVIKSVVYASAKLKKMVKSQFQSQAT